MFLTDNKRGGHVVQFVVDEGIFVSHEHASISKHSAVFTLTDHSK